MVLGLSPSTHVALGPKPSRHGGGGGGGKDHPLPALGSLPVTRVLPTPRQVQDAVARAVSLLLGGLRVRAARSPTK